MSTPAQSWWALDSTLKLAAEYQNYYRSIPPVACPNCGEPLRNGPPQAAETLFCIYDGWSYPEDYDVNSMAGM